MAASSSSIPSFIPQTQSLSAILPEIQKTSALSFKEALSVLLKMNSKGSPPSKKRLEKLGLVYRAISENIPSNYKCDNLKKIILIFKKFYYQKNATPKTLERTMSGYPLQEVQDLEKSSDYHRLQHGTFWKKVVKDLLPGVSIDPDYTKIRIVKHREFFADLKEHNTIYFSVDERKLAAAIPHLIQNIRNRTFCEKKIYIVTTLNQEEKKLAKPAQYALLLKKIDSLIKLAYNNSLNSEDSEDSEDFDEDSILSRFMFMGLMPISPKISLIAYAKEESTLNDILKTGIYAPTMLELHEVVAPRLLHTSTFTHAPLPEPLPLSHTIDNFLTSGTYRDFTHLAAPFNPNRVDDLSIVPILASANSKMIRSLVETIVDQEKPSQEDEFIQKERRFVLSETMRRVKTLLRKSVVSCDNLRKFYILHELIAEEIILLLHLLSPYKESSLQEIFSAFPSTNRFEIPPSIQAFSSGLAAFNASMRTLTKAIGRPPKLIYTENLYFEINSTLSFEPAKNETDSDLNSRICCLENDDWESSFEQKLNENFFPDAVLLSIRSLPTPSGPVYTPMDKIQTFLTLLTERQPQDSHLTIFLDTTNEELHSIEIIELVNTFATSINEGSLSFFLFRSGHKFLQLGVDKVNIGYAELHTGRKSLAKEFEMVEGKISNLDYQTLCHYLSCAHHEIHHYTKLHQQNSKILYDYLCDLTEDKTKSGLKMLKNNDSKTYFVQFRAETAIPCTSTEFFKLRCPGDTLRVATEEAICRLAAREGIPVHVRDSFGFNESVLCNMGSYLRISVGTHSPDEMEKLCRIFRRCHETIRDFNPKNRLFREGESEESDEYSPQQTSLQVEASSLEPLMPFTQLIEKIDQL